MTTTLQIDSNFDLVVNETGMLGILTGDLAIAQNTTTATSTRRGECLLDTARGIPFDATAFSNLKLPQLEAALRATIRQVEGVTGINSLNASQNGESLEYEAEITTVNSGAVPINL